jgi:hypothetical protein
MLEIDQDQIIHDLSACINNFKTVRNLLQLEGANSETAKTLLQAAIEQLEAVKQNLIIEFEYKPVSGNTAGIV